MSQTILTPTQRNRARMDAAGLAIRYVLFAAIATAVNIGVQIVVSALYRGPFYLTVAMAFGTVAGLLPKYLLDSRWIFDRKNDGVSEHARNLPLYTLTSVGTTLIFWAFEYAFAWFGNGGNIHYLGAVIGLAVGYCVKYQLDRRFVFAAAA